MPSDGKSSRCLWQGELIKMHYLFKNALKIRVHSNKKAIPEKIILGDLNPISYFHIEIDLLKTPPSTNVNSAKIQ
jgi:hypothetical protein